MNEEVFEALRSAQELCAYLRNNAADPEAGKLAELLHDARTRIDAALQGLEAQCADVGRTENKPHGPVSERLMQRFYGPPK